MKITIGAREWNTTRMKMEIDDAPTKSYIKYGI